MGNSADEGTLLIDAPLELTVSDVGSFEMTDCAERMDAEGPVSEGESADPDSGCAQVVCVDPGKTDANGDDVHLELVGGEVLGETIVCEGSEALVGTTDIARPDVGSLVLVAAVSELETPDFWIAGVLENVVFVETRLVTVPEKASSLLDALWDRPVLEASPVAPVCDCT